ncbi:AAA family ATPase [Actinomadura gamaensis]
MRDGAGDGAGACADRAGDGGPDVGVTSLIGRDAELARVLASCRPDGDGPRELLVLGKAGAGKTALLEAAARRLRAEGALVLRAQGDEAESRYSFACLHQLLLPLLRDLDALPAHLREPLDIAFGMVAAERPPDPLPLRIAVLTLLTGAARRRPVVLVVDDVQHFDRDSADVLGFVTRRLADPGIAVLLAARGDVPPPQVTAETPVLALPPLPERAAAGLLDAQPRPPAGRARLELLRQAEGNPLAIIELSRAAAGSRRSAPSGNRLSRVQETFAARLRTLPEATRRAVLYAAAAEGGDLATVTRAAGHDPDLTVWRPAEDAGLVTVTGERVVFRHPLVRAAAYRIAPAHLRRQAHHDLAAALRDDADRSAWHRAAACVGDDESVAAELEAAAGRAAARGGWFAAARALERAAECTPGEAERARRYGRALSAADQVGDPVWVRDLHERLARLTGDPDVLGAAARGTAMALSLAGRQREAVELLTGVLDRRPPRDGRTVLSLTSVLGAVAFQSGLPEARRRLPEFLAKVRVEPGSPARFEDLSDDACALVELPVRASASSASDAALLLDPSRPSPLRKPLDGPDEVMRLLTLGSVAWHADESDLCVESFRTAFAGLRAGGAMGQGAPCLVPMAASLLDTGRWDEADALLAEIATLAAVHHLTYIAVDAAALRATLDALRGRPRPLDDRLWTAVPLAENRVTHAYLLRAASAQAEAADDLEGAYRHLRGLYADGEFLHPMLSPRSIVDLADLAVRTGRPEDAAPLVEAVRADAGERPTARMAMLLHHATALLDDSSDAEHHYRLATVNPAGQQWPLHRARARLHYARWLRRRRRPSEARPLLSAALDAFTRLGAVRPAEETSAELRATGLSAAASGRTRSGVGGGARGGGGVVSDAPAGDPLSALTAQQQQIVRLAAQGLANREIAERLMLSPRTVGSHLYQAYPKLGVSRRHQLREIVERG